MPAKATVIKKQPIRDGSVLEPLIPMHMDVGASEEYIAMSLTLKKRDEEKLDRLGTMSSEACRKVKYARNELPRTSDDLEGRDPKTAK